MGSSVANSAAPTYYCPSLIGPKAITRKQPDDEIMVVPLGTGKLARPYPYEDAES